MLCLSLGYQVFALVNRRLTPRNTVSAAVCPANPAPGDACVAACGCGGLNPGATTLTCVGGTCSATQTSGLCPGAPLRC